MKEKPINQAIADAMAAQAEADALQQAEAKQKAPPLQLHFLEALDSLANIAKAAGNYPLFINAMLYVTTIIWSEIHEGQIEEIIGRMAAQSEEFRTKRKLMSEAAANEAPTTQPAEQGAPSVH